MKKSIEKQILENLAKVNQAMQSAGDAESVIDNVLDTVYSIFGCDRIWLFHPCDPNAPTFQVLAEKNHPKYPGAFITGQELPVTPEAAEIIKVALASGAPVAYNSHSGNKIDDVATQFSVLSQIMMAVHPTKGSPWMLGMHQCSYARVWDKHEQLLFQEIGYRVVEGLNNLLLLRDLKKSEEKYRQFFSSVPNGWAYHKIVVDNSNTPIDYIFLEVNPAFEELTGLKREGIIGKKVTEVLPDINNDPADWIGVFGKTALEGISASFENYAEQINKWFAVTSSSPQRGYFVAVFQDITKRKKAELERDGLIHQLQEALAEVKTLRGIIPICASCKKIRDDKGYWNQMEQYIMKHSEAEFSHGFCQECVKKLYPELGD